MPRARIDKDLSPIEMQAVEFYVLNECTKLAAWQHMFPNSRANRKNQINAATRFFSRQGALDYKNKILSASVEKIATTIADVLTENDRIAFSDIRDLFSDEGFMLPIKQWPDSIAAAVSSIEVSVIQGGEFDLPVTVTKIKLWSKCSALERLFKHFGAYELDNSQRNPFAEKLAQLPVNSMASMLEKLDKLNEESEIEEAEFTEVESEEKPKAKGKPGRNGVAGEPKPRRKKIVTG